MTFIKQPKLRARRGAMRTASISLVTGAGPISSVGRAVVIAAMGAVAALDRWQARRQALRQLYMLDRHTLRDLGIDRSELQSIVYGDGDVCGRRRHHADH
jgi:uncharacterized protein YjiS (DUF1127 family)